MTELLFGERFLVIEEREGWAFGQASRDSYVGYVRSSALGSPAAPPTHWVRVLRTYAYVQADLKTEATTLISMNSLVTVEEVEGKFSRVAGAGWVFSAHLSEIGGYRDDPAEVALEFLGAPYRWGGRQSLGLDCSGLVQNVLHACGISCPRDSDLQADELGVAAPPGALQRGDLVFWDGHVGMMVDDARIVHANGHHLAVALEPLSPTFDRIADSGAVQPVAYRRVERP
jgi:cell wall-associated NlpC family hydrolase